VAAEDILQMVNQTQVAAKAARAWRAGELAGKPNLTGVLREDLAAAAARATAALSTAVAAAVAGLTVETGG
jgi:hypothetical protein